MSASAVYTIATVQLHVQTLLDPSIVCVTILILEMEKHARTPHQVNMSLSHCTMLGKPYLYNRVKRNTIYFMSLSK